MRLFLTQSSDEIKKVLLNKYPNAKFIGHHAKDLQSLGESIKALANADIAVFFDNSPYEIEHSTAVKYGIPVLYMSARESQ